MEMEVDYELQERVLFVTMGNSKVFFDCHPAEARIAIEAVKEYRKTGVTPKDQVAVVRKDIEAAVNDKSRFCKVDHNCNSLTVSQISELITKMLEKDLRVTTLVLSAREYGDVWNWGLAQETCDALKREGVMHRVWGINMVVNNKLKAGDIRLVSSKNLKYEDIEPVVKRYKLIKR
jgi:hypothetical protein